MRLLHRYCASSDPGTSRAVPWCHGDASDQCMPTISTQLEPAADDVTIVVALDLQPDHGSVESCQSQIGFPESSAHIVNITW